MPQVATHLLGSTDGYTTKAHSPDLSAPEIRELEDLIHGQAEDPNIRANLGNRPTALLRRLQSSGRYAISRILAGPQDSTGRETLVVCSIVLDPKAFAQTAAGDMWSLLKASQLWRVQNFSSGRNLSIPDLPPVTRAVTQNDAILFDTWVRSRNTPNGLGVVDNAVAFEQALVNLGQVLHPSDRAAYMWGCHLLSPQSPAQLGSFANPDVVHRGRRTVIQPSATPQTLQGQAALQSVGKSQLPSSDETPIRAQSPTIAWENDRDAIELELSPTVAATRALPWSQPNSNAPTRSPLPRAWLAVGSASLIALAGTALFGILQYKRHQLPMPDTQVTATRDNPDSVEITWVAGERAITHSVERSEASASPLAWESLGEQASPFRDNTGKPGIKYVYRVRPGSAYGVQGEPSNSVEGLRPPAIPSAITVNGAGKQARIEWAPVQGASKYELGWKIDDGPISNLETSSTWAEIEVQPGETLVHVQVVARSSENIASQPGSWSAGFEQTKTELPDAVRVESIAFECVQSPSGQQVDLRVTWQEPERCDACTYEIEIAPSHTSSSSSMIETASSPEYTILGAGKYEAVTVLITTRTKDTLGKPLSSTKAKATWRGCPIPTDFGLKTGTEWTGDSFDVTWTGEANVAYSVKLSNGTTYDQPPGASTATIRGIEKTAMEVTLELVCVRQDTCPRSTPPITVKRANSTSPPSPAEPAFLPATTAAATRFLEIASAAESAFASDTQLRERMNDALGLKDNKEFKALKNKDSAEVRVAARRWLNCVCSIVKAQIEAKARIEDCSYPDIKKLAEQLMALQRAEPFLLGFIGVDSRGLNLDAKALSEIEGVVKLGEKRFREWLEARYSNPPPPPMDPMYQRRKKIWDDGLDRLSRDRGKFAKELSEPGILNPPTEIAGKNKKQENDLKLQEWKQVQLPTWLDLAIYACVDDPALKETARSELAQALNRIAKDSKDLHRAVVSLSEFPLFDYALSRVATKKP